MKDNIYFGGFSSKEDIEKEFSITLDADIKIIFAEYYCESYEGIAFVLFTQKGELYEVSDSHCSCNGLDSWSPELTTWEAISHYLEKGTRFDYWEGKEKLLAMCKEELQKKQNPSNSRE